MDQATKANPAKLLADILRNKPEDREIRMLIGAGASLSAGIPSSNGLIDKIREKYPAHFEKKFPNSAENQPPPYGEVMAMLTPDERKTIFEPYFNKATTNWGQIALARLMEQGYINKILTCNFDLILERALTLLNEQIPVYDFATAPSDRTRELARRAIIHLHGQEYGLLILNSDEETKKHQDAIRPLIGESFREHTTIIFGYSGEADHILPVIEEAYNNQHRLIWLAHDETPKKHLEELLDNSYADYYGGLDFDLFMIELAQELKIWPPEVITNPLLHVKKSINNLPEYPQKEETQFDIFQAARGRIGEYKRRWEDEENIFSKVGSAIMKEGYNDALATKINECTICNEAALTLFSAYFFNWGNALAGIAKTLEGEDARESFKAAGEKYEAALEIKADFHEALNNWGIALAGEAHLSPETKRQELLSQARKKLEALKTLTGGAANYNFACILALEGNRQAALDELKKCHEAGKLPDCAHLANDADLEALRQWDDFKKWFEELCPS